MTTRLYQYRECGLENVWLANGFDIVDAPSGRHVKIKNIDGLHKAIGRMLITNRKRLSGKEIRFLRQELLMSQTTLAKLLEVADQTVHRWETDKAEMPKSAEALLRLLYREHIDANSKINIRQKLEKIADLEDKLDGYQITLRKNKQDAWVPEKIAA